jgi:Tfp pilus assembly protein PilZ
MGMTHKTSHPGNSFSGLRNFFRYLFNKKEPRKQSPFYERNFSRFPMEFEVRVDFVDKDGTAFQDTAELRDISGSGAFFVSEIEQQYHVGQTVFLTIYLAGTNDVGARVRVESSVVRIEPIGSSPFGDFTGKTGIAVKFNETFAFERMDKISNGDF